MVNRLLILRWCTNQYWRSLWHRKKTHTDTTWNNNKRWHSWFAMNYKKDETLQISFVSFGHSCCLISLIKILPHDSSRSLSSALVRHWLSYVSNTIQNDLQWEILRLRNSSPYNNLTNYDWTKCTSRCNICYSITFRTPEVMTTWPVKLLW